MYSKNESILYCKKQTHTQKQTNKQTKKKQEKTTTKKNNNTKRRKMFLLHIELGNVFQKVETDQPVSKYRGVPVYTTCVQCVFCYLWRDAKFDVWRQ